MGERDLWIVVPNWDRFQHYGDRVPVWIKLYTALNSDPDWALLPPVLRGVLVTCWVEYARSRGQLHSKHVATLFGSGWKHSYLKQLNDAGLLQFVASKPPAHRARPEKEKEEEKNPLTPTERGTRTNNTNPRAEGISPRQAAQTDKEQAHHELLVEAQRVASGWQGTDSAEFDAALDHLEQDLQGRLSALERDNLWNKAFSAG